MKRPFPPDAKPGRSEHDIKKAYTTKQLVDIAAIALKYNQIESIVEFILLVVLDLTPALWLEVVRRISGMEAKISILRRYYEVNTILTDDAKTCLKIALDGVMDYKKYRDLIIHSEAFDIDRGISQHVNTKAEAVQILVTEEALAGLYERLCILAEELVQVDILFRLGNYEDAKIIYPHVPDPLRVRRERDVPVVIALVRVHQNRRLSLPPLPEFPSEEEIEDALTQAVLRRTEEVREPPPPTEKEE